MTYEDIQHIHSIQSIIDADRDKEAGRAGGGEGENDYLPPPKFFPNLEPVT